METTRRAFLAIAGSSVAVAGCLGGGMGGGDGDGDGDGSGTGTVQVSDHDEFGEILVDADGMTLYLFDADEQGSDESACYDDCEAAWPPLTVEDEPTAGGGVNATLSTFEREDGSTQLAADGWPLYYFASDESPGDASGQGANDVWWVVDPDGGKITEAQGGRYDPY